MYIFMNYRYDILQQKYEKELAHKKRVENDFMVGSNRLTDNLYGPKHNF